MDRGISISTIVSSQFILKSVADVLGEFGETLAHFDLDMHELELAHFQSLTFLNTYIVIFELALAVADLTMNKKINIFNQC